MQLVPLGRSGIPVSRIAFGCMSLQGSETENISLLHEALDGGINFFDTADLYDKGANEASLGKAFKGKRDQVVIATKVGNQWRTDGSGWDWNPTKPYILASVEGSLRRLQTDYIDLYQLHGGTIKDNTAETIEAFEQLKSEGKIRHYGISSIRPNVVRRWVAQSNMATEMVQYSLLDRRPEEEILPLVQEKNIGVLVRGAVAQGLLLGKPAKPYLEHDAATVEAVAKAVEALDVPNHTAATKAIQWVLANKAVTTAVIGIRTKQQLADALYALQQQPLPEEAIAQLNAAAPVSKYQDHR